MARQLTLHLCEAVKRYYSKIAIVFSGCAGFHVHVMDFNYYDWVQYHWKDPLWAHHAARFKFTKLLQKQTHVFDRAHFTVSVDPMRVVTVSNTRALFLFTMRSALVGLFTDSLIPSYVFDRTLFHRFYLPIQLI